MQFSMNSIHSSISLYSLEDTTSYILNTISDNIRLQLRFMSGTVFKPTRLLHYRRTECEQSFSNCEQLGIRLYIVGMQK